MALSPAELAYKERAEGRAPTGIVTVRDFDQGVVETLGAKIIGDHYLLQLEGFDYPPGIPGVVVTYIVSEELFQSYVLPVITVSRDDLSPAMHRWHPGSVQYRAPARGSLLRAVGERANFGHWEEMPQAVPFDFTYTINILTRSRSSRSSANRLLDYVLRVFPPYCRLLVTDSVGDVRSYEAQMTGTTPLDEVAEVSERTIGFAVTIEVQGELDLNEPKRSAAALGADVRLQQR